MVLYDRVEEAKGQARYSLVRTLDNTEAAAATRAELVKFNRSRYTITNFHRVQASLAPKDLQDTARKYFTNENLVVTTLWKGPGLANGGASSLPAPAVAQQATTPLHLIPQKSVLPQIEIKLLFNAGSANDPVGKEGLARLSADMIADAGSRSMQIDAIRKALLPQARTDAALRDKE